VRGTAIGAVLLAGSAVTLLFASPARSLRPRPRGSAAADERSLLLRLRPVLAALAFHAARAFIGGPAAIVAGAAATLVTWRVLGRTESPATRRRRAELDRDLPAAVHLLGACLAAGAATSAALEAVASALPGAVAEELTLIRHRLELGVDPLTVWRDVGEHAQLRPLGRSMARAHVSGASVRDAVEALATDLAAQSRTRTDALARSVEVRAAAPLGACFLPAFVLLGVVPMIVGVFGAMSLFG
jgi:Flp pilus assembly protein TadB